MGYKNEIDQFMLNHMDKNPVLVFDVSGSYEAYDTQREIANYINGIKTLPVLYVDSEVQGLTDTNTLDKPKKFGGSTSFTPAFEWAKENGYGAVIYSTDGYGDVHENETMPTLWLLDEEGSTDEYFSWGDVIKTQIRGFDVDLYFYEPKNFLVKTSSTNEKAYDNVWFNTPAYEIHSADLILMKRALSKTNNHPSDCFNLDIFPS